MLWLVGIGIGIGVFLLATRTAGATTVLGLSHEDVEYLARMICMEHPNGDDEERIGIAWVAINRLRSGRFGESIREVVTRENFAGSGARGDLYRRLIQSQAGYTEDGRHSPVDHPRFDEVIELCFLIARGEAPSPIGSRLHFLHPSGMPSCSNEGARDGSRVCYDGKWLPEWALQNPVMIGITLFS